MTLNAHCVGETRWTVHREQQKQNIMERIRRRYSDYQFTVEVLAYEVGMSLSQLRERIHFDYGMSPQELIETVRLEEAVRLLFNNVHENLYELCANVGYMNLRTFLDAFKRRTGVTPTRWRSTMDASHDSSGELDRYIELLWTRKRPGENIR